MALNAAEIAKLQKQLEELNKIYEKIGEKPITVDISKATVDDLKLVNDYLSDAKTLLNDLDGGFGGIAQSIKNITREWKPGFADPTKEATKSFTKLKGIAEKLSDDVTNITVLNKKQLQQSVEQIKSKQKRLNVLREELKKRIEAGEKLEATEQTLLANLESEYNVTEDLLTQANKRLDQEVKIQKTLGITGKIFQGISSTLGKIGVQSEQIEEIQEQMRKTAEKTGSQYSVLGTAIGGTFKAVGKSLSDPLVSLGLFAKGMKMLIGFGNEFSKNIYDISKNQAISYEYARLETQRLQDAAMASNDLLGTRENFVKATNELNDALGLSNTYSGKQLEDYNNLTQKLGLSNEEAARYNELSAMGGKTAENIVNSVAKQAKGNISNKKVIQEVAKVNGQLYAQYKGSPELLAKAVVQTQKLGMTLQQAQNISKGLLNFEDSITNELEAELLTGKDLNLEKARYLALQGDAAGAAEEVAKQVGGITQFTKLNVIQQEALAKAAGMGVDEFTDTLRKKEAIKKLDQGSFKEQFKMYQAEIKKAKEAGDTEKAAALEKAMYKKEDFKLANMEFDNAVKAQQALSKAKDSFASAIAPIMEQVSRFLLKIADFLNNPTVRKVLAVAGGVAGIAVVGAGVIGAVNAVKGFVNRFKFGKRDGSSPANAQFVEPVGGGGGGGGGFGGGGRGFGGSLSGRGFGSYAKDMFKGGRAGKVARGRMFKGLGGGRGIFGKLLGLGGLVTTGMGLYDAFTGEEGAEGGLTEAGMGAGMMMAPSMMGAMGSRENEGGGSTISKPTPSKPTTPKPKVPKPTAAKPGFFSKMGKSIMDFGGRATKFMGGGLDAVKNVIKSPIVKGIGKALGPILTTAMAVGDVMSLISNAKSAKAAGEKVDTGKLGKSIVQSSVYPIANFALNAGNLLFPGLGTAASFIDATLGAFGYSPVKFLTDNLIDFIPNEAFGGLGRLALGENATPAAPKTKTEPVKTEPRKMATGGIVTKPTNAIVGEAGPEAVVPLNKLMQEFKEMKMYLAQIANKEGAVYLDSTKVGTALTLSTSKIQ